MSLMTPPPPLPEIILEPIVRLALAEDLGRAGDLTSDATIAPGTKLKAVINAREAGICAGLDAAAHALTLVDADVVLQIEHGDGAALGRRRHNRCA